MMVFNISFQMSNTRAPNFTKSEENLLLSLVSKYKNILECKLSNTDANQKKKKSVLEEN